MALRPLSAGDLTRSVGHRLAEIAGVLPDLPALVSSDTSLDFRRAHADSDRLAAQLALRLAAGDAPLALLLDHGVSGLLGLLGALKLGRPAVLLDTLLPAVRLEQIARTAGVCALLTQRRQAELAGRLSQAVPLQIDLDSALAAPPAAKVPRRAEPGPDSVALIVFTSGSTGAPKGVVWTQRTLMNEALAGAERLGFTPADRVALVLPYAFAAGVTVFLFGLLNGAGVYAYDPRTLGVRNLPRFVRERGITTLHTTPSLLRSLVASLVRAQRPERLDSLRLFTTCGEAVHARDVASLRPHLSTACSYVNWSGASEIGSLAFFPIAPGAPLPEGLLPAGFAAAGKEITLHREDGAPAEPGEAGEVHVRSGYCAAGYFRAPEATAARFQTEPDGRTRYRMGDLGRFAPDGSLVLLGRRDAALKIRGYLVEPAEVEAALRTSAAVSDTVVIATDDPAGGQRLVAYVVPRSSESVPSSAALRGALRARLPSFMVPATIIWLPELPRNERGKVDRLALPPPAASSVVPARPRSQWELVVADLWMKVLHLEQVNLGDDFVELGGDSLAAAELLNAVSETLGIKLPSNTLVEAPTLGEFAGRVGSAKRGGEAHPTLSVLRGTGQRPPLFCFAGAGGLGLGFMSLARQLGDDQPVYAFQAHGLEQRGLPDWSVARNAERHIRTIRTRAPRGPYFLVGHSLGGLIALEVAQRLARAGEHVALVALLETHLPGTSLAGPEPQRLALDPPAQGAPQCALAGGGNLPSQVDASRASGREQRWRLGVDILRELHDTLRHRVRTTSLASLARLPLAGLVQYPSALQFDVFFRQGRVLERFYYPRPWRGRTLVFRAEDNHDAEDAWAPWLTGSHQTFRVPCEHFSVLRDPHVAQIARHITAEVDQILLANSLEASPLREFAKGATNFTESNVTED